MRFASHRDFSRAFERALLRAGVPMAYSSGFNPHPRISYAGAAPTGAASEAEYLEIGLARRVDADHLLGVLQQTLPEGLDVVAAVEAGAAGLADLLEASRWQVELALPFEQVADAVEEFLAADAVRVSRMTRKGMREFDCRAAAVTLRVFPAPVGSRLDLVIRHTVPAVRPDDVLAGLCRLAGLEQGAPVLLTRVAQGPWDAATGQVGDPLAPAS